MRKSFFLFVLVFGVVYCWRGERVSRRKEEREREEEEEEQGF